MIDGDEIRNASDFYCVAHEKYQAAIEAMAGNRMQHARIQAITVLGEAMTDAVEALIDCAMYRDGTLSARDFMRRRGVDLDDIYQSIQQGMLARMGLDDVSQIGGK